MDIEEPSSGDDALQIDLSANLMSSEPDIPDDLNQANEILEGDEQPIDPGSYPDVDLYDELFDSENEVEKPSELKHQLLEQQKQIEELTTLNSELEKQNKILLNNISSLFSTCKLEIQRKDGRIKELNERFDALIFKRNGYCKKEVVQPCVNKLIDNPMNLPMSRHDKTLPTDLSSPICAKEKATGHSHLSFVKTENEDHSHEEMGSLACTSNFTNSAELVVCSSNIVCALKNESASSRCKDSPDVQNRCQDIHNAGKNKSKQLDVCDVAKTTQNVILTDTHNDKQMKASIKDDSVHSKHKRKSNEADRLRLLQYRNCVGRRNQPDSKIKTVAKDTSVRSISSSPSSVSASKSDSNKRKVVKIQSRTGSSSKDKSKLCSSGSTLRKDNESSKHRSKEEKSSFMKIEKKKHISKRKCGENGADKKQGSCEVSAGDMTKLHIKDTDLKEEKPGGKTKSGKRESSTSKIEKKNCESRNDETKKSQKQDGAKKAKSRPENHKQSASNSSKKLRLANSELQKRETIVEKQSPAADDSNRVRLASSKTSQSEVSNNSDSKDTGKTIVKNRTKEIPRKVKEKDAGSKKHSFVVDDSNRMKPSLEPSQNKDANSNKPKNKEKKTVKRSKKFIPQEGQHKKLLVDGLINTKVQVRNSQHTKNEEKENIKNESEEVTSEVQEALLDVEPPSAGETNDKLSKASQNNKSHNSKKDEIRNDSIRSENTTPKVEDNDVFLEGSYVIANSNCTKSSSELFDDTHLCNDHGMSEKDVNESEEVVSPVEDSEVKTDQESYATDNSNYDELQPKVCPNEIHIGDNEMAKQKETSEDPSDEATSVKLEKVIDNKETLSDNLNCLQNPVTKTSQSSKLENNHRKDEKIVKHRRKERDRAIKIHSSFADKTSISENSSGTKHVSKSNHNRTTSDRKDKEKVTMKRKQENEHDDKFKNKRLKCEHDRGRSSNPPKRSKSSSSRSREHSAKKKDSVSDAKPSKALPDCASTPQSELLSKKDAQMDSDSQIEEGEIVSDDEEQQKQTNNVRLDKSKHASKFNIKRTFHRSEYYRQLEENKKKMLERRHKTLRERVIERRYSKAR